jgi:ligand-binding SRPBCC domain-containing protein
MRAMVEQSSMIPARAGAVWERAITEEGINYELKPLLRMTMPRGLRGKSIDEVEAGVPLGRSWILLFGVIPIDYDDLRLVELEAGRRFLERSKMGSMRVWQHERIVEPTPGGCRVTDRLAFELRGGLAWIPGSRRLASAIVGRLFARRHRRLAASFSRSAARNAGG